MNGQNELSVYDGVLRYPVITQRNGGIHFMEAVLTAEAKVKLPDLVLAQWQEEDGLSIVLKNGLDGSLSLCGFPCEMYRADRAEFEAAQVAEKFRKELGIDLALVAVNSRCFVRR